MIRYYKIISIFYTFFFVVSCPAVWLTFDNCMTGKGFSTLTYLKSLEMTSDEWVILNELQSHCCGTVHVEEVPDKEEQYTVCVETLIKFLESKDEYEFLVTIFKQAIEYRLVRVIALFLKSKVTCRLKEVPSILLLRAIETHSVDLIDVLLRFTDVDLNKCIQRKTPLLLAIKENEEVALRLIQDPRIDVNLIVNNESPLHAAIMRQSEKIVDALIRRDARVDYLNRDSSFVAGKSIVAAAVYQRNTKILRLLLQQKTAAEPLYWGVWYALRNKDSAMLRILVEEGHANLNFIPSKATDLVSFAIKENCSTEIIHYLLDHGADPYGQGNGPIKTAISHNRIDVISLLHQKGLNVRRQFNLLLIAPLPSMIHFLLSLIGDGAECPAATRIDLTCNALDRQCSESLQIFVRHNLFMNDSNLFVKAVTIGNKYIIDFFIFHGLDRDKAFVALVNSVKAPPGTLTMFTPIQRFALRRLLFYGVSGDTLNHAFYLVHLLSILEKGVISRKLYINKSHNYTKETLHNALCLAVSLRRLPLIRYLLEHGANPHFRVKPSESCLELLHNLRVKNPGKYNPVVDLMMHYELLHMRILAPLMHECTGLPQELWDEIYFIGHPSSRLFVEDIERARREAIQRYLFKPHNPQFAIILRKYYRVLPLAFLNHLKWSLLIDKWWKPPFKLVKDIEHAEIQRRESLNCNEPLYNKRRFLMLETLLRKRVP